MRDGTFRDMASMHGSYRKVAETLPALQLLGDELANFDAGSCRWFLDRPVSNSGRLKTIMEELAAKNGWPWRVELANSPDRILVESPEIAVTADSAILDRCHAWFNLARVVIENRLPQAWIAAL